MKRLNIVLIIWLSILILSGCRNTDSFSYEKLIPQKEGEYTLFHIPKERSEPVALVEWPEAFSNPKLTLIQFAGDVGETNKKYPEFKVEKKPAYIFINYNGEIYKTYEEEEAIEYVERIE